MNEISGVNPQIPIEPEVTDPQELAKLAKLDHSKNAAAVAKAYKEQTEPKETLSKDEQMIKMFLDGMAAKAVTDEQKRELKRKEVREKIRREAEGKE